MPTSSASAAAAGAAGGPPSRPPAILRLRDVSAGYGPAIIVSGGVQPHDVWLKLMSGKFWSTLMDNSVRTSSRCISGSLARSARGGSIADQIR